MSTKLTAKLTAKLQSAPSLPTGQPTDDLVAMINSRIAPPEPIRPDQIHIRSMRLVSDAVNDHGGRFPVEEHDALCALLVDSPVLIGHDRSRLPVARNFAARSQSMDGNHWIKVWFYWMRGEEGDRLAEDIDGGIVKEGSIGFEFRRPQCSICGEDIRICDHLPGSTYKSPQGQSVVANYEYREITRVLETSLVYRGATPGTRLDKDDLSAPQDPTPSTRTHSDRLSTRKSRIPALRLRRGPHLVPCRTTDYQCGRSSRCRG